MCARLGLFALAILTIAACGEVEVRPDSRSGKDFERAGAKQLFFDKLVDDYLDAEEGDNTDWKYLKIRDRGFLELTIYWDNKEIESEVEIRDRFGVLLDSRRHSSELEKDKIDLKVEPGTHFVRMTTQTGGSVYTMEAIFKRFDHRPTDDVIPEAIPMSGDLLDEPLPMAGDPIPSAKPRHARRGARARTPHARRARVAVRGIRATIVRLIKGRGGSVLTLNRGSEHGLREGQTGVILNPTGGAMPGGSFSIIRVKKRSASAVTKARPKDIAHRRSVKVEAK